MGLNCIWPEKKKTNHKEGVLKPNMAKMDEYLYRNGKIFSDHEQLSQQSGNL